MHQFINKMNTVKNKEREKGFTLIELLVVIAIIAILSSVVLASLNSARTKGRDAKRISDIKQIKNALEIYRNDFGQYPVGDIYATGVLTGGGLGIKYISSMPKDPKPNGGVCSPLSGQYCYAYSTNGVGYHIGAQLETVSIVGRSDADASSGSYSLGNPFSGAPSGGSNDYIYDLTS